MEVKLQLRQIETLVLILHRMTQITFLLKNAGTFILDQLIQVNSLGHVNFGYNNNRGIYLESGQHNFIDGSGGSGRNKIYSVISGVGGVTYGKDQVTKQ